MFRLDPDEALTNLWETLKAQRILPTAAEEAPGGVAGRPSAPSPVGDDQSASRGHASGVQVQRGADVAGERDLGLSDQLRVKPSDPPSTDEAGVSDRPPEASAAADPNERSPQQQGRTPHQPILLPPREPIVADRGDGLAPYVEWTWTRSVPDPRTARPIELASVLAEVARVEGPVVAIRAYRLINRASGSQRLTTPARSALNRACYAAVRSGNVVAVNPLGREGQAQLVLRSPESPEVILRVRGPRELDELPPDEVAMMLRSLRETTGQVEVEALKRQALDRLGWMRLTRNVNEFFDQCIALM